jgi:GTP cyclohydrolase II
LSDSIDGAGAVTMAAVGRAAAEFRRGRFVLIEGAGEAALTQAAETVSTESLHALTRLGNGGTRLALTGRRATVLAYPAGAARVVTLDLGGGFDADLIRALVDPGQASGVAPPKAIRLEGALPGSVPSGAIMLSKLAQLLPAALCAPVAGNEAASLRADERLARVPVAAITAYPKLAADSLRPVSEARMPLAAAEDARLIGFRQADGGAEQFAIVIGDPVRHQPTLCRLHSECFTGDLLGSLRCDCGPQLEHALERIGQAGHGVLLYLAHEGRGIGLINKLRAYRLQDAGLDTMDANEHLGFEPDERSYRAAAIILGQLGIRSVRLLTNNPDKVQALQREGIEVAERVPHLIVANRHNRSYLRAKALRGGHIFDDAG